MNDKARAFWASKIIPILDEGKQLQERMQATNGMTLQNITKNYSEPLIENWKALRKHLREYTELRDSEK